MAEMRNIPQVQGVLIMNIDALCQALAARRPVEGAEANVEHRGQRDMFGFVRVWNRLNFGAHHPPPPTIVNRATVRDDLTSVLDTLKTPLALSEEQIEQTANALLNSSTHDLPLGKTSNIRNGKENSDIEAGQGRGLLDSFKWSTKKIEEITQTSVTERANKPNIDKSRDPFTESTIAGASNISRTANEEMCKLREENKRLHDELSSMSDRYAKLMGDKISSDESDLENIGVRTRPVVLADDYKMFTSKEWLDAKEFLEKTKEFKGNISEQYKLLTDIIEESVKQVESAKKDLDKRILTLLRNPLEIEPTAKSKTKDSPTLSFEKGLPPEVNLATSKFLRACCDQVDYSRLGKKTFDNIPRLSKFGNDKELQRYSTSISKIAWGMILQQPPMRFVSPKTRDDELVEPHFSSSPPKSNSHIKHIVFPGMMLGEKVMVKGQVIYTNEQK